MKGHSIKELIHLSAEERLFMWAFVEKDCELKQKMADEIANTTEKQRG